MMRNFNELYDNYVKNRYSFGTGAWSVVNNKIKMKLDEYGEYVPYLEQGKKINNDELDVIKKITLSFESTPTETDISRQLYSNIKGINHDNRIGYYLKLYAGHVKENSFRENASSGGFGTWIFKELFERKMIDGVIHVKESLVQDKLFEYSISKNLEEIIAGAKTRYYPVEFSEVLNIVKETPGRYAIIGLPSYIMSIRLLACLDPIIKERIKFTVGLVCGHQKTTKFADCLAWQCGIKPGNLKYIDFRKKLDGLPASSYGIKLVGDIEGKEVTLVKKTSDLEGSDWGQGFFKCKASDFTDDVFNETADITLGDAWLPQYINDSKGNNVIIIRNPEIEEIFRKAIEDDKINVDLVDKETIFSSQASHYRHTHDELSYRLYKKDKEKTWRPIKRIVAHKNIPFLRRKVQDLREETFIKSHILYKEAVEKEDLDYFLKEMDSLTKRYRFLYKLISIKKLGIRGTATKIRKRLLFLFQL